MFSQVAVTKGYLEIIDLLLTHRNSGCEVTDRDQDGLWLLHHAVLANRQEVIEHLLENYHHPFNPVMGITLQTPRQLAVHLKLQPLVEVIGECYCCVLKLEVNGNIIASNAMASHTCF